MGGETDGGTGGPPMGQGAQGQGRRPRRPPGQDRGGKVALSESLLASLALPGHRTACTSAAHPVARSGPTSSLQHERRCDGIREAGASAGQWKPQGWCFVFRGPRTADTRREEPGVRRQEAVDSRQWAGSRVSILVSILSLVFSSHPDST